MTWTSQDDDRIRAFCRTTDVGKLKECPKCGTGAGGKSAMMLANFCTHKYCPFRDWKKIKLAADRAANPYYAALDDWKKDGDVRPANRPDGIPTRTDRSWMTPAELAILEAVHAVEHAGGSLALTDAVILLSKARERVADHVEGKE
jgi:hypothetical protein